MSRETDDHLLIRQEGSLQQMREELEENSNILSSGHIQNKVITLRKFQSKISPSGQSFEQQEEELIEFREEHHYDLIKFSYGLIQNEVLTINSEHPSAADQFEIKLQYKIYPSDQSFEKREEEFIDFKEEHHNTFRKYSSGPIQNEVITLTSEHLSSEDHFEKNSKTRFLHIIKSLSNQNNN